MRQEWNSEQFEVYTAGVNSAVDPRLIGQSQLAWAMNMSMRGGTPSVRPAFHKLMTFPAGLYQGSGYFSVQDGMLVSSVAGNLYKIKVGEHSATYEQIQLTYPNHPLRKMAWFCQTVESMVIQDGQSRPIIYDGVDARRSDIDGLEGYNSAYDPDKTEEENLLNLKPEVPIGRQMAYGNGRLWVATGNYNLIACDIRTNLEGSELKATENTYLNGGGALYFPSGINALGFSPMTGAGETGSLVVCGQNYTEAVRADISNRDIWQSIPAFVSPLLRNVGCAGQWSMVSVNQELYWRDNQGGIRSIRSATQAEMGSGNTPMSAEVRRITDHESERHLEFVSSIQSDNRLLMTGNPFLLGNGGVGFKSIISLDFANISTMSGKSPAAYDGHWTGFNFVQLISGIFAGKKRDFVVVYGDDKRYHLFEIKLRERDDKAGSHISSIIGYLETGRKTFGDSRMRKRLERFDVYLSDVNGPVSIEVFWRTDNFKKWQQWGDAPTQVCAKITDSTTTAPHTPRLLMPQSRPSLRTFTIPTRYNSVTSFQEHVGYEFQFRVKITGRCKIYRMFAHATMLQESPYRGDISSTCETIDLSGNSIKYEVDTSNIT